MATAKRLGDKVFDKNDPLDDLRPAKQRKVLTLSKEEPPTVESPPPPVAESFQPPPSEAVAQSSSVMEVVEDQEVTSEKPATPEQRKTRKGAGTQPDEAPLHGRIRFSANVPVALKQRTENAAYWVPGLTISAIVEVALERELRRLEKDFNDGRPFEKAGKLKYGRPRAEG
jgi:hypothetical protein